MAKHSDGRLIEDLEVSPVRMDGTREWRTEGEIRNICRDETGKMFEKLVDGAQASINTSLILHGNPELGIKGALPDIQERLQHLEEAQDADRAVSVLNHRSNTQRLQVLEDNQGKIRNAISSSFSWAAKCAGQLDTIWKVVGAAAGGVAIHAYWEAIMKTIRHIGGR